MTVQRAKDARITVTVTVENDRASKAEAQALRSLAAQANIKGFRPGKAPLHLVQAHISPDSLRDAMLKNLIPEILRAALQETNAHPILQPFVSLKSEKPLVLEIVLIEEPIATIKKSSKVRIEKKPLSAASDAEVDTFIQRILRQDQTTTPVDRAAQKGDRIVMSLRSTDAEGKPFEPLTIEQYPVHIGEETLIAELNDHAIGMKPGETKNVTIDFAADHRLPVVQGKKLSVNIEAREVHSVTLPALTAEYLAKKIGTEKSPEAFRSDVRDMLTARTKDEEMKRREDQLYDAITNATSVELPSELIDAEAQNLLLNFVSRLQEQKTSLESWMATAKKTPAAVMEEMRSIATGRLKLRAGLRAMIQEQNIRPSDDDIMAAWQQQRNDNDHADAAATPNDAEKASIAFELSVRRLVESLIADDAPASS